MRDVDNGSTRDGEIKTVMAGFCMTARSIGAAAAQRAAAIHLVAATAYLEEAVGPARTKQILSAAMTSIGLGLN